LECQQALLSISGGTSIGLLDCLCLALGRTLFKLIEDEGEEEWHGKDRDKEIHDQNDMRRHAGAQTL
jgi:hypothetical protein